MDLIFSMNLPHWGKMLIVEISPVITMPLLSKQNLGQCLQFHELISSMAGICQELTVAIICKAAVLIMSLGAFPTRIMCGLSWVVKSK